MIPEHPDLFWGLVASMWVGNCFLLFLNVPLVRYWLSVFKIPYRVLFPAILFFCCIGTFSVNNNIDDVYITAFFGVLGYTFMRLQLDPAPLMLGFILGPMLEENLRRALLLSHGQLQRLRHATDQRRVRRLPSAARGLADRQIRHGHPAARGGLTRDGLGEAFEDRHGVDQGGEADALAGGVGVGDVAGAEDQTGRQRLQLGRVGAERNGGGRRAGSGWTHRAISGWLAGSSGGGAARRMVRPRPCRSAATWTISITVVGSMAALYR